MDEQVELLRGIWDEMKVLNGRVSITNDRLDDVRVELKSEIGALRVETRDGLTELRGGLTELRGGLTELRGGLTELRGGVTEVRDGLTELRGGVTEVRGTLVEVRDLVVELRDRIELVHSRSVERDLRLGTAFADLALDVRDIKGVVHAWHDEQRLDKAELEERIERLERHVGLEPPP